MTGGGALIKGTTALAREILGMPVKIGIPGGFHAGLVHEVENPMYATCVGLVLHGAMNRTLPHYSIKENGHKPNIIKKIAEWFNEL